MTYTPEHLAAASLSDLLDAYFTVRRHLDEYQGHKHAGNATDADHRQAYLDGLHFEALTDEIAKRAKESQR